MTDLLDVQPLDLSCPAKFWHAAAAPAVSARDVVAAASGGNKLNSAATAAMASSYAKLSVAIPRRYSNCSDNVSFADSDRSPSISPASDRLRQTTQEEEEALNHVRHHHHHRLHHHHHNHNHMSDSELSSSSLGSDSEGDPSPSPLVTRGPATKRFLSKYIKEQVGKQRLHLKTCRTYLSTVHIVI